MAPKRITLTKAQLAMAAGKALLGLLLDITADGEITIAEVQRLREWLAQHDDHEVPALAWLRQIVDEIVADGRITLDERRDLVLAIERVMPKGERGLAQARRKAVEKLTSDPISEGHTAKAKKRSWTEDEATEPQINYIRVLGGEPTEGMTKGQASALIDQLLGGPSNRQVMVLRFWDQLDLQKAGRDEVSQWMDEWYAADPHRKQAWELWKTENADTGGQDSPERVPIGAGSQYLKKVKGGGSGCLALLASLPFVAALVWLTLL